MSKPIKESPPPCIPEWLDNKFVLKCVQSHFSDKQINIVNFTGSPVTSKGENFLSDLVRLDINYTDDNRNSSELNSIRVICKLGLKDHEMYATLSKIYEQEMEMYDLILPKLTKLIGGKEKLFANTIYVSHEHDTIIFEDLNDSGYCIDKEKNGYDLNHTKLILIKLAKFHAASAVLDENEPMTFNNFQTGNFNKNN